MRNFWWAAVSFSLGIFVGCISPHKCKSCQSAPAIGVKTNISETSIAEVDSDLRPWKVNILWFEDISDEQPTINEWISVRAHQEVGAQLKALRYARYHFYRQTTNTEQHPRGIWGIGDVVRVDLTESEKR